jgi:DNA processing protein
MDKYIHAFWHLPGTSYVSLGKIWNYFGDFKEGWERASERDLLKAGLSPEYVRLILVGREKIDLDAAIERLWSADIFLIGRNSTEYPKNFSLIEKSPFLIYRKGENLNKFKRKIAIVGMRKSTMMGEKMAYNLTKVLAQQEVVVVSGLAFGIDAAAHSGAVASKAPTIGVLASGIGRITPSSHYSLAQRILECGGSIISEYPVTSPGMKHQFIERNRLISGMVETVVIVEAGEKSGALITARHALEQGKNILAFPGDPGRIQSKGCNNLIKNGEAHLVDSIADVQMHLKLANFGGEKQAVKLNENEKQLAEIIKAGTGNLEEIHLKIGGEISPILSTLSALEIEGIIERTGLENWRFLSRR